jgi:AcrR family transcriptional regulator
MGDSSAQPLDADTSTRERILAATAEVLSRNGTTKLSFSEVALQAGVSRQTLYRWFAAKEDLLDAFGEWERQMYGRAMARATAGLLGPERLEAALRFIVAYQQSYPGARMVDLEPGHVIGQLSNVIPVMRERLERLMSGPDSAIAAATAIRVSHYLVRSDDAEQFLAQLRHAVAMTRPAESQPPPEADDSVTGRTPLARENSAPLTVHFHGQRDAKSFARGHTWKTIEGGALEITRSDGEKVVFSPSYWASVQTGGPD